VAWAHSLAGSSATVGFDALSQLSRALELALIQSQRQGVRTSPLSVLFVQAAEAIRRALHQFAAGFLPPIDEALLASLHDAQFLRLTPVEAVAPQPLDSSEPEPQTQTVVLEAIDDTADAVIPVAAGDISGRIADPVAAVPVDKPVSLASEDDIDVTDAIDPDLFPIFEEEALELMPNLGAALRQWSARADNPGARNEALRLMHTLKGSARLAGAMRLGEMIHRLESEVEYMGADVREPDLEPLVAEFDRIAEVFEALRAHDARAYQAAIDRADLQDEQELLAHASITETPTPATEAAAPAAVPHPEAPATALMTPVHATPRVVAPTALAVKQANQSVRVRSHLLDRMVNQAGEVMMTRSRLEAELGNLRGSLSDLTGNLDKLRGQLRDIELQAETQMQSRLALAKEAQANFDPLEFDRYTRVQELTRMMAESVNDVATVQRNLDRALQSTEDNLIMQARQTRELQRDLLRTRMVEFEGISERLYRVVRLASKETAKQVRLDITGGQIEMDRGMLDRMTPAFEHLLRNCVAHGIEEAGVRQQAGKDAIGLVSIVLSQEGNDVNIEFRDDGAGLNLARIREKAVSLGLLDARAEITPAQAGDLIFMPGFSTASEVTELAGRGIGMDVVRAEVYALGGRIDTSTEPGKGTCFKLVLPLTTAVTQVVMIRSGELTLGVPSTMVEVVRRTTPKELEMAYNSGHLELAGGENVAFYWSGALLQSSQRSMEPVGRTIPVIIFRSAAQRVALHVDEVLGNQEVVVKNLGSQLSRLPGLAGMTVLPTGAVVLIYNPVALSTVYGKQARIWSADRAEAHMLGQVTQVSVTPAAGTAGAPVVAPPVLRASQATPLVLVVDDSITVRKVTQRLLQREGFRVALAADGLQALERLQEELPGIVLSDIEMPRMDGFDLARNIRGDANMKHLPIVMITSRIAEKHREHAQALGVNHYLGKPYSEEELLSLVRRYCLEEVTA
jgi:chemosensory pili system protein ChpA (sensor histidine kinase/response regulator)